MKKIKISLLLLLMMILSCTISSAVVETKITKVEITGIAYPYSTGSVLDTDAEVSDASRSIISKVAWSRNASGLYVVTVTLRPNINCYYSTDAITATINGKVATNTNLNEDKYLEVSYAFPKDDSERNPNSSNSLRHIIYINYSRHGVIEPENIRVPDGQSVTVKIIPDEGYKIRDVIVDGESVGAVSEYTFKKVKESHKIRAYYEVDEIEETEEEKEQEQEIIAENKIIYSLIKSLVKVILK